jgi:hypothetical protein
MMLHEGCHRGPRGRAIIRAAQVHWMSPESVGVSLRQAVGLRAHPF